MDYDFGIFRIVRDLISLKTEYFPCDRMD